MQPVSPASSSPRSVAPIPIPERPPSPTHFSQYQACQGPTQMFSVQIKPLNRRDAVQAEGATRYGSTVSLARIASRPCTCDPSKDNLRRAGSHGKSRKTSAAYGESTWSKRKSQAILLRGPTVSFCTIASLPATCAPSNDNLATTPTPTSAAPSRLLDRETQESGERRSQCVAQGAALGSV